MTERQKVLLTFPNLDPSFQITSAITPVYNCIAWAANDDKRFWWPTTGHWPDGLVREEWVANFEEAFAQLGYTQTGLDDSYVAELEKVAIYIRPDTRKVTHMARQLANGRWTSKLGKWYDIEHRTPACLNGKNYGTYLHCLGRARVLAGVA